MTTLLKVENISKRFGGLVAINDLSFDVSAGEILGIVGPNGAGKSTLFDLLSGFQRADKGSIIFDNKDVRGVRPDRINKAGIARTFQKMKPFSDMTVVENVIVGALAQASNIRNARAIALDMLVRVDMFEKRNHFARELSTGQRKRLELARSLATKPKLLLIDEITGGVDQRTIPGLVDLILNIKSHGTAIITIEHNMQVIMRVADRILALRSGQKIALDTPERVRSEPSVIDAYLGNVPDAA